MSQPLMKKSSIFHRMQILICVSHCSCPHIPDFLSALRQKQFVLFISSSWNMEQLHMGFLMGQVMFVSMAPVQLDFIWSEDLASLNAALLTVTY